MMKCYVLFVALVAAVSALETAVVEPSAVSFLPEETYDSRIIPASFHGL